MRILPRPFGQVLNDAVAALMSNWKPLFTTSLMVFIPSSLLTVLILSQTGAMEVLVAVLNDPGYLNSLPPDEVARLVRPLVTAMVLTGLVQAIATILMYLVSHRLTIARLTGREIRPSEARTHALRRFFPALLSLAIALAVIFGAIFVGLSLWSVIGDLSFAGLLVLAVALTPAVWFAVSVSMITPVTSVEPVGPARVLLRSMQLVRGRWGVTFGFLLLVALLGSVASLMIQWITPLTFSAGTNPVTMVIGVIGIGAQGLIMAAIGVAYTHWYLDLRARQEPVLIDQL